MKISIEIGDVVLDVDTEDSTKRYELTCSGMESVLKTASEEAIKLYKTSLEKEDDDGD